VTTVPMPIGSRFVNGGTMYVLRTPCVATPTASGGYSLTPTVGGHLHADCNGYPPQLICRMASVRTIEPAKEEG
jgi:hypothetical protein